MIDRLQKGDGDRPRGAADRNLEDCDVAGPARQRVGVHAFPGYGNAVDGEGRAGLAKGEGQRVVIGIESTQVDGEGRGIGKVGALGFGIGKPPRQAFLGQAEAESALAERSGAEDRRVIAGVEQFDRLIVKGKFGRRQEIPNVEGIADATDGEFEIAARAARIAGFGASRGFDATGFEQSGHGLGRDFNRTHEDGQALNGAFGDDDDGAVRLDEFEVGAVDAELVDTGGGRQAQDAALFDQDHLTGWLDFRGGRRCRNIGLRHERDTGTKLTSLDRDQIFAANVFYHENPPDHA